MGGYDENKDSLELMKGQNQGEAVQEEYRPIHITFGSAPGKRKDNHENERDELLIEAEANRQRKERMRFASADNMQEMAKPEARPARQEEERYWISTANLWLILSVLCVVLMIALVWQQYYRSHTYEKGELAAISADNPVSRRRFLTETEFAGSGNLVSYDTEADTMTGKTETERVELIDLRENGQELPEETERSLDTTRQSQNLRNQLRGVLPGIL